VEQDHLDATVGQQIGEGLLVLVRRDPAGVGMADGPARSTTVKPAASTAATSSSVVGNR